MSKGKATRTRATAGAEQTRTHKRTSKGKAKPKNKPLPTERRLTVSSMHRPGSYNYVCSADYAPVPFLRLAGRWLEAAGFGEGAQVLVQIEPNRLVVTPAPPPSPSDGGA